MRALRNVLALCVSLMRLLGWAARDGKFGAVHHAHMPHRRHPVYGGKEA